MIIDGTNLILGRLGSYVAKKALLGVKVEIINCENIVVTGKKYGILKKYTKKLSMGTPSKGPFVYKKPDRFVKRAIRGMLPYKKERGKKAFKNIKCYIGIPENLSKEKIETVEIANIKKVPSLDYIKVKDISRSIGGKIWKLFMLQEKEREQLQELL